MHARMMIGARTMNHWVKVISASVPGLRADHIAKAYSDLCCPIIGGLDPTGGHEQIGSRVLAYFPCLSGRALR
jgi:hypothetical protein